MPRKSPVAVATAKIPHHEAHRAWRILGGDKPTTVELWRKASRSKPAIYRLLFARPRRPTVYAKRSVALDLGVERVLYQEILPRLPLTVPRYLGSCRDEDDATWMFVESVGDRRLLPERPEHRALAGCWLGMLHRSAAADPGAALLPDAGPARYLGHLRAGRDAIHCNFDNPGLTAADRSALAGLIEQLDRLEELWPRIEQACTGMPATLVHADFRLKNVRVRGVDDARVLYVLDWEMAGWGVPAADLASARASALTVPIDTASYLETVREQWPDVDADTVLRLSIVGRIFQALAGIDWAGASLRFETPSYLLQPVSSMRVYRTYIAEAAGAAGEWLTWS